MINPHELKQLQTRLTKAEAELATARENTRQAQKSEASANKLCADLRVQIASAKEKRGVVLTEHAMLRYFERVLGYDLEEITAKLLSPSITKIIEMMPNGKIPSDGCRLVVQNRTVVTVEKS